MENLQLSLTKWTSPMKTIRYYCYSVIVAKFGNQKAGTCLGRAQNFFDHTPFCNHNHLFLLEFEVKVRGGCGKNSVAHDENQSQDRFYVSVSSWFQRIYKVFLGTTCEITGTPSSSLTRFVKIRGISTVLCQPEHGWNMGLNCGTVSANPGHLATMQCTSSCHTETVHYVVTACLVLFLWIHGKQQCNNLIVVSHRSYNPPVMSSRNMTTLVIYWCVLNAVHTCMIHDSS